MGYFVNLSFLGVNPFFDAYAQSDLLGKLIFLSLVLLSVLTWVILLHKIWVTYQAKRQSQQFHLYFSNEKSKLLTLEYPDHRQNKEINPFLSLFQVLKKQTTDILNKNKRFGLQDKDSGASFLSPSDIDVVESHLMTTIATQTKNLEKNLFILATVVALAPFLGLLGTVWGILTTFSELQSQGGMTSNQAVLGGLSMALATTVLGLVDAIPALIGYNYLKSVIKDFSTDMQCFSNEILAYVEMRYRKVDVK